MNGTSEDARAQIAGRFTRGLTLMMSFFLLLTFSAADAQTVIIDKRQAPDDQRANVVQVQIQVELTVPNLANGELSLPAQERARRALYEIAAHECEVLRAALANDCRLQSLNVGVNPQYGQPSGEALATGNLSFGISLK